MMLDFIESFFRCQEMLLYNTFYSRGLPKLCTYSVLTCLLRKSNWWLGFFFEFFLEFCIWLVGAKLIYMMWLDVSLFQVFVAIRFELFSTVLGNTSVYNNLKDKHKNICAYM